MSNFLAYISRMKYIKRWGLMRSNREENVQEHSLQVAMFAHCLALIENKRYGGKLDPQKVMAIAVYHETGEVITGDLVTPIKYYNPQITQAYKDVEKVAEETMISMLPEEFQEEYRNLIQPQDSYEAKIVKLPEQVRNLLRGIAIKMQERVHHEDCIRSIDNNLELSRKMLFDLSYKPKKDGLPF
jgi:5'-deoxynucleotidase